MKNQCNVTSQTIHINDKKHPENDHTLIYHKYINHPQRLVETCDFIPAKHSQKMNGLYCFQNAKTGIFNNVA